MIGEPKRRDGRVLRRTVETWSVTGQPTAFPRMGPGGGQATTSPPASGGSGDDGCERNRCRTRGTGAGCWSADGLRGRLLFPHGVRLS